MIKASTFLKIQQKYQTINLIMLVISVVSGVLVFSVFYKYFSLPQFAAPILPEIQLPQKNQTVVIFAPHCDDEVLGSGGLIYKSIQNGARVCVVLMTNGDGQRYGTIEEFGKIIPALTITSNRAI